MDSGLLVLQPPDVAQQDDAVLDSWLASLTPDQFQRFLESLADSFESRAAAS